jgi:aspartate beta-hydroxylase
MNEAEINRVLAKATKARAAGNSALAETHFRSVLEIAPNQPGALNALGLGALARNDAAEAAALFERAAAADPAAPALWMNLAKARRSLGQDEAERESLTRVLEIDQRHLMALIRMAELHERLGEDKSATQRWSAALAVGRLLDQRPPELEAILAHAATFVESRTRQFADKLEQEMEGALAGVAPRDRRRFTACLDYMNGRRAIYTNQCAGLHYPFLPADEFFDREHFPWLTDLEANTPLIRAEAEKLLADPASMLAPYVSMEPGAPENKWTKLDRSLDWGALHLWREGERIDDACALCPVTAAIMEELPLAQMPRRAPTVFFSVIRPRTRIPAHTGVSNVRTIVHLPLIIPEGCGFRVGGETREWKVGEAFAFDDTIEHEAWNDSDEMRIVLIFDVWNPHISEAERGLLQNLFRTADANGQAPDSRTAISEQA